MSAVGGIVNGVFDLVLRPLAGHAAWAMVLVSAITAVWALLLFKATTPQRRLERQRDRLTGHIYEMGLYQDHLGVIGRIQRDFAVANLRYVSLSLPALVALAVPMVLTLAQLDSRFAHRPLHAGEAAVFSVQLDDAAAADLDALALAVPAAVNVEAGPVRDATGQRVAWRVSAREAGRWDLRLLLDGAEIARRVLPVGGELVRLGEQSDASLLAPLLRPGVQPPPRDGPVAATSLRLPARHTRYLGLELPWLVAFMIFSLAAGLAVKDVLRVSL